MKQRVLIISSVKRFVISMTAAILLLSALMGFGLFRLIVKDGGRELSGRSLSVSYSVMNG